jgi:hypothetical protein
MGIKSIKTGVAAIKAYNWAADTYCSLMDKIFGKPIGMEIDCPARFMYPQIFSGEETVIGKCPYGEVKGE